MPDKNDENTPQNGYHSIGYYRKAKRFRSANAEILKDNVNLLDRSKPNESKFILNDFHFFCALPEELVRKTFHYVDVMSLGLLALVDKKILKLMYKYITSKEFVLRIRRILQINVVPDILEAVDLQIHVSDDFFAKLAFVFKRSTIIMPTLKRLTSVNTFIERITSVNFKIEESRRWGYFWHLVIAGWQLTECTKAYSNLIKFNFGNSNDSIERSLTVFLDSNPGQFISLEYRLREFFRRFILDYVLQTTEDEGFWLDTILNVCRTTNKRAKLLYLIYGPLIQGTNRLDWNLMCSSVASNTVAEPVFRKIVDSLRFLSNFDGVVYSVDAQCNFIEELTSFPNGWLLDNFGYLLLMCDEKIAYQLLILRIKSGHFDEVGYIFHVMCSNCARTSRSMSYLVHLFFRLIATIPNESNRMTLVKSFSQGSDDALMRLYGHTNLHDAGVGAHEAFIGLSLMLAFRALVTF